MICLLVKRYGFRGDRHDANDKNVLHRNKNVSLIMKLKKGEWS